RSGGPAVKAVAFAGPRKMELRDIPEPQPAAGEVVVQVAYCGVCGSDLHEFASDMPSMRAAGVFQPVMGHEFTGTISALGEGVNGFSIGEPVGFHPGGPCCECAFGTSAGVKLYAS